MNDGQMEGWKDGRMEGWIDGWMDGWVFVTCWAKISKTAEQFADK